MALDLEKALPPASKVIIAGVKGADRDAVVGYLTEDFTFGVSSSYDQPFDTSGLESYFNKLLVGAKQGAAAFGLKKIPGLDINVTDSRQLKLIRSTLKSWTGTDHFTFTIPMVFLAFRPTDDVRKIPSLLMGACSPDFTARAAGVETIRRFKNKDLKGSGLVAGSPNDYFAVNTVQTSGTVSVNIGNWFRTGPFFIISACSFAFSKEIVWDTGIPLVCGGNITFQSFRVLSRNEVMGFFV
jgi:hypothetical protein